MFAQLFQARRWRLGLCFRRCKAAQENPVPRQSSKRRKPRQQPMQTYVFEIREWRPSYTWSVNLDKVRESPYREHLDIRVQGLCVFPAEYDGRSVEFFIMAERNAHQPSAFQNDPDWSPRCVGCLVSRSNDGRFYMSIPHDSFASVLASYAHGAFRFIDVYGPRLSRGKSYCSTFHLAAAFDPEDY